MNIRDLFNKKLVYTRRDGSYWYISKLEPDWSNCELSPILLDAMLFNVVISDDLIRLASTKQLELYMCKLSDALEIRMKKW